MQLNAKGRIAESQELLRCEHEVDGISRHSHIGLKPDHNASLDYQHCEKDILLDFNLTLYL